MDGCVVGWVGDWVGMDVNITAKTSRLSSRKLT